MADGDGNNRSDCEGAPCLRDLLIDSDIIRRLSSKERDRIEMAIDNTKSTLMGGLIALGNVLAAAGSAGRGYLADDDVAHTGWLIAEISGLLLGLEDVKTGLDNHAARSSRGAT